MIVHDVPWLQKLNISFFEIDKLSLDNRQTIATIEYMLDPDTAEYCVMYRSWLIIIDVSLVKRSFFWPSIVLFIDHDS